MIERMRSRSRGFSLLPLAAAFVAGGCSLVLPIEEIHSGTEGGVDSPDCASAPGTCGAVAYGTESAPWAANDPINTRYTGTPGPSANFSGSTYRANSPTEPWAIPIYYEREYVGQASAVQLNVVASTDRGFGTRVAVWVPAEFHAQVGSNGYSDGDAVVVRTDGSIVNFFGLGGHGGGTNTLPGSCEFFNIARIDQSGMKRNTNQWGTGFSGPRTPQWAANTGIIDGYFMSATTPFRGLVFVAPTALNTPRNCGHATYNYSGNFDGSGSNTGVCEGQHYVIPATTPKPSTLTPEGSYLWDVFVQYGAYNGGSGGNGLPVARSGPAGTTIPQVTQAQVDDINQDISVLFENLHFAND